MGAPVCADGSSGVVERSFYAPDATEVAPLLLNKLLVRLDAAGKTLMSARVVEVEAYLGSADPASHAYKGETARNAVMFGPAGHMYVYFTYGMHYCANVVCRESGVAQAVLLRALAPEQGLDLMRAARASKPRTSDAALRSGETGLTNGPARLCQAFGITREDDGADLVTGDRGLVLVDDGVAPPEAPEASTRVGIRQGRDRPWRWFVAGDRNVTRARPVGPA